MRNWAAIIAAIWCSALSIQPVAAGPALLFEPSNGKILYAEDIDSQWYPASLTKVMTAYLTFEAIKEGKLRLDDKVKCSLVATLQPPSKIGLPVGGEMSVEMAVQSIIIKSANDVTVMLAEAVAGSERAFVEKMNATAQRLGMTRTYFVNTSGLPDPAQVSTARDLAKLARAVTTEYGQYGHYWSLPDMRLGKRRLGSHNALLRTFPGADGLKTGFTCDSGFNVIASATRDGRRLMAVVLGESSGDERAVRSAALLEHGFANYGWKAFFNKANIDNLAADPAARSVISAREHVVAWNCGNDKKRAAEAKRKRALKVKAAAKKKKTNTGQAATTFDLKGSVEEALGVAPKPAATASP